MRTLWPIEQTALEAMAQAYPLSAVSIRSQIGSAKVTNFENTGGGFFSTVSVSDWAPIISEGSPLDGAQGTVDGVEDGMGFLAFLEEGRLHLIEGFSFGGDSTTGIDFEHVQFDLKPCRATLG